MGRVNQRAGPENAIAISGRALIRLGTYANVAAGLTALIALLSLISWSLSAALRGPGTHGSLSMHPLTAVALLFASISLGWFACHRRSRQRAWAAQLGRGSALIVAGIGLARLSRGLFGNGLKIDQWLFHSKLASRLGPFVSMPANTAINLVIVGAALLFLHLRSRRRSAWAISLSAFSGLEALLGVLTFLHHSEAGSGLPIALPTAAAFFLVNVSIIYYQLDRGGRAFLTGAGLGGRIARRLLPAAILVPAIFAWIRIEGALRGLYDAEVGVLVLIFATIIFFVLLFCSTARSLYRADTERTAAEWRLRRAHRELETRVASRTVELSDANAALERSRFELEARVKERTSSLAETEARLQAIVENTTSIILLKDLESKIILANDGYASLVGLSKDQVIGRSAYDLFPKERADKFRANDLKALRTGAATLSEESVIGVDGVRTFVANKVPLRDACGEIYALCDISTDITERKQMEDALRESKQELEAAVKSTQRIMDNSPQVICTVDAAGCFMTVSAACEILWGYQPHELIGRPYIELVFPDDRESTNAEAAKVMGGTAINDFGNRYVRKDGSLIHVMWSASWSEVDQMMFAVAYDVSARRHAEEALRQHDEQTRLIVETAYDAFIAIDAAGLITGWNRQAEITFGWSRAEALGRTLTETIIPPEHRQAHQRRMEHFQAAGNGPVLNQRIEITALRRDGREFPIELTIWPIQTGETYTFNAFLRDITERRQAQAAVEKARADAEQANRAKSEFLSRMSHELRTPMNAILGFAQLLELDELSDEQRDGVGHIRRGGEHLLGLITEVLEISRIEAGKMSLLLGPVEVSDALRITLDLVRPLAQARDIRLQPPSSCVAVVRADPQRLQQVLINLISNAIKYNRLGGAVTVACEKKESRLRISVVDTGIGIPTDRLAHLFVPFERLGAEQSTVEGTGLGLAVVKRLIEAMEGTIGVESVPGRGSTFWIELPLTDSPLPMADVPPDIPLASAPASERARKILYIEDNASNLRLVERLCQRRPGTILLAARDGMAGLDMARQHRPDLILLDVNLPDMDGSEVLVRLFREPACASIPVVMLSADATADQRERLLRGGAVDYITKPIDVQRFFEVVDRTLADSNLAGKSE